MKMMWAFLFVLFATPAMADDVNLILSPGMAAQDAPFYRGARIKIGDNVIPVQETSLPNGALVEYNAELNAVLVSSDETVPSDKKSEALMNVLAAFEAGAVETAAGLDKQSASK